METSIKNEKNTNEKTANEKTNKDNVKASSINSDLKKLQLEMEGSDQIRPCLFNLIVYTNCQERKEYFQQMVLKVIEKFPCLIIFIQKDNDPDKDYLNISVSTETSGSDDLKITSDQITLKVGGKQISRIPYIIFQNLITDLPIYLVWGQDPTTEKEILPHFQGFANSIIFDSESIPDLNHFSNTMEKYISTFKFDVVDMNWARLSGWREILAKTFDSSDKIKKLSCSKLIQITFNECQNLHFFQQHIQAFYLQGWIASQLEWKFLSLKKVNDVTRLTYENSNHHPVTIDLCPKSLKDLPPGSILAVETLSEDNHFFTMINRDGASPFVKISISSAETCDIPFTMLLPNSRKGFSFIKDIFYGGSSDHYLKMLGMTSKQEFHEQ